VSSPRSLLVRLALAAVRQCVCPPGLPVAADRGRPAGEPGGGAWRDAHIFAESPNGPRGDSTLTAEQRSLNQNLILLCNQHHQLIDSDGAPTAGRGLSAVGLRLRRPCPREVCPMYMACGIRACADPASVGLGLWSCGGMAGSTPLMMTGHQRRERARLSRDGRGNRYVASDGHQERAKNLDFLRCQRCGGTRGSPSHEPGTPAQFGILPLGVASAACPGGAGCVPRKTPTGCATPAPLAAWPRR
jgi:hypothetical protein